MKRPILLLALAATLCATQNLFAWGRLGHATVARIAEEHLTKKARANLDKWLDGESIVYYASWLDDYKPQMLVDLGYDPAKGDRMHQLPHTFSVDAEGEVVPGNRWPGTDKYLANCLYYIEESADMLKNRIRELDDSTRLARIQLIVHCVGDMHCPAHIRYPGNTTIGYYKVDYFGREMRYHTIWDSEIVPASPSVEFHRSGVAARPVYGGGTGRDHLGYGLRLGARIGRGVEVHLRRAAGRVRGQRFHKKVQAAGREPDRKSRLSVGSGTERRFREVTKSLF